MIMIVIQGHYKRFSHNNHDIHFPLSILHTHNALITHVIDAEPTLNIISDINISSKNWVESHLFSVGLRKKEN